MMNEIKVNMKWIGIVLFVSLAVNFFLFGYFYSHKSPPKPLRKLTIERPILSFTDYFSRTDRRSFYKIIRDGENDFHQLQRTVQDKKFIVFEIFSAQKIDEEKLKKAFKEYRLANDELQRQVHLAMIKFTSNIDVEARKKALERLKKRHFEMKEKFHKRHKNRKEHSDHQWKKP